MKKSNVIVSEHSRQKTSRQAYTIGFLLSVALTIAAFFFAANQQGDQPALSSGVYIAWILALAVIQLGVQLQFFIHLGHESKPRWNKIVFLFMAMVVLIVVLGSLWIMSNLDYHHGLSPSETEQYIREEELIR